ncbi:anthranilate synthase alpha subunit 2, chloroplastic isoform X1 [Capsicum galapagoense]
MKQMSAVYVVDDSVKFKEAVKHGNLIPRYSVIEAQPIMEIVAKENMVTIVDHFEGSRTEEFLEDPMINPHKIMEKWKPQCIDELPEAFCEQKHALLTKIASVREVVIGALLRAVLKQLVTRTVPPDLG